ncbi:MAG: transglycosylase SLT domain-containing protein, partial [Vicinamibacteraceae bacterium]
MRWLGVLALLSGACGGRGPAQPVVSPAPKPSSAQAAPAAPSSSPAAADPVAALIATSERLYANGQRELAEGHLDQARREFDRSVSILLESSAGARADARLRDHFDRLVDRISAQEASALAEGDGFNEGPSEPAPIDELLAIASTFDDAASAPAAATAEIVRADLAQAAHDIPIPLNDRVLNYVELFQGRLRGHIQSGMDRGAQYLPMIQKVFKAEGLPLDLAYIPLIESAFKPVAESQKRARGVWQFMRATSEERGLETNWFVDERSDPEKSTRAAADYLKWLYAQFGDWHLALASYNGGPGRVQRAMKRSGIEDFWALSDGKRHLPRETREYVPLILAAMVVARNPTQYGFAPMATDKPLAYDSVTVTRAVDLRRIAEWTDTPLEGIQSLNPELRRWTTPVRADRYDVKVPPGTGDKLREHLANATGSDLAALHWYRVKRGESVATIARKLGVSRGDLAEANGLAAKARVRPGQDLLVPRAPSTALVARAETHAPAARNARVEATAEPRREASRPADPPRNARVVYKVRRGDTLERIARAFDTTVAAIKSANRLRGNRSRQVTLSTCA